MILDELNNLDSNTLDPEDTDIVIIQDKNLENALRKILSLKKDEFITRSSLESLVKLDLSYCDIKSLEGLEYAININFLDLRHNNITNLSSLCSLYKLENLNLSNNNISNLKDLSNLNNLFELKICNNKNLYTLDNMPKNIYYLDISNNKQIKDFKILYNLDMLKTFIVNNIDISDITPFKFIKNLESIVLNENNISNLKPLLDFKNISSISLCSNKISDISCLKDFKNNINFLNLTNNYITDFSPLLKINLKNLIALNQHINLPDIKLNDKNIVKIRTSKLNKDMELIFMTPGDYINDNLRWHKKGNNELTFSYYNKDLETKYITSISGDIIQNVK